jgi:hypothetical protein
MHPNVIDLTGQRFERLIVEEQDPDPRWRGKEARWICHCSCGKTLSVPGRRLRVGKHGGTRSCGCLLNDLNRQRSTHGLTRTPEYRIWAHMKARCILATDKSFPRYGGRGITVCEQWLASFPAFLADMGQRPSPQHSLERLDNNGPYSPGNCCWATSTAQGRNKRNNVLLAWQGETRCLSAWSELLHIDYHTLKARLRKGWPVERILTTPVRRWPSQIQDTLHLL